MPTRPWSHPLITMPWPSVNSNGCPESQDESNSSPVSNSTPTYCIESLSPFFAAGPLPTTMSFTSSFVGGLPVCLGTWGFDFVSFRFVDACGVVTGFGGGPLADGMSAVVALLSLPQPATVTATRTSAAEMWLRVITAAQASEPGASAL